MRTFLLALTCGVFFVAGIVCAQEVEKGKIPEAQLATSFKKLDWGVAVWDEQEAIARLKTAEPTLWVDTRPESFFKKGTVQGAVLLPYNKQGGDGNEMTSETLAKALQDAGLAKENTTIVMFCQGPKCHRSYNATFIAVTEWGYSPEKVVWFRAGYPLLFEKIQNEPKLKRKAKKYISDAGVKQL